ncbi:PTS sugar transporter subunit IIA [Paraburkholderia youngii]|uniref:PTS sugar transporter subunit IIA n=1 Tax=Paraburkholderia youngii TaxID=2782701 RepID=UPI003D20636F
MMHVTLDAQHATPLRQALIRDCAGQPWTIRLAALPGAQRVRLSLYLPRHAVSGAIDRVAHVAPTAELVQLFEVPDTPTGAWRDLMNPASVPYPGATVQPDETAMAEDGIAQLLSPDHVLLDLNVAERRSLFVELGRVCEQRFGVPAETVSAALEAREALGSTALGQGLAVPYAQIKVLRRALALYVRPAVPIPFDAPDGYPVSDAVMLLVPQCAYATHLHLLADVAQRFCDHHFRERLHACIDAQAVCQLYASYVAS